MWRKALTSLLLIAGCTRPYRDPCEPAGRSGNQLSAALLERYDQNSTLALYRGHEPILTGSALPSCGGLDGLHVGISVALLVGGQRYGIPMGDGGCWIYGGALQSPPPGLQFTPQGGIIFAGDGSATVSSGGESIVITYAQGKASVNGCSGYWLLAFEAPGNAANGATFGAPTPDAFPPAAVTRVFVADTPQACPSLPDPGNGNPPACADTWIAQLTCLGGPCRN